MITMLCIFFKFRVRIKICN